jgi:hypothetical protein
MAQLLLQGTNFINFVGYNAYVGGEGEVSAVTVTEWDEPQAVIGSYLQKYAYPDYFAAHQKNGGRLQNGTSISSGDARCIAVRGEYLYVAEGTSGMHVYDAASIGHKGVSDRLISAPVSPLGQSTNIPSKEAPSVARISCRTTPFLWSAQTASMSRAHTPTSPRAARVWPSWTSPGPPPCTCTPSTPQKAGCVTFAT